MASDPDCKAGRQLANFGQDKAVEAVASKCKQLTTLCLSDKKGDSITEAALMAVAKCKLLKSLSLCCCHEISDAEVVAVASGCPQLTSLNLAFCWEITDEAVLAVASRCKQLKCLDLTCCYEITDAAVVAVASGTQLEWLAVDGCENITDAAMANFRNIVRQRMGE